MQPRRWFRIHLSTAIVMTLVAGALLSQVIPNSEYIAKAVGPRADLEWNLEDTVGNFESSVKVAPSDYTYQLTPKPENFFYHFFVVRGPDGKELLREEVRSHEDTQFLIHDDILYYPRFCIISSGCAVRAFDLKSKTERWSSQLEGIGAVAHSMYRNTVRFKRKDNTLVIYGDESQGQYVALLNLSTGQTIASRAFNRTNFGAPESPLADLLLALAAVLALTLATGTLLEVLLRRAARRPKPNPGT